MSPVFRIQENVVVVKLSEIIAFIYISKISKFILIQSLDINGLEGSKVRALRNTTWFEPFIIFDIFIVFLKIGLGYLIFGFLKIGLGYLIFGFLKVGLDVF